MKKIFQIIATILASLIQISFLSLFPNLLFLNLILAIGILLLFYDSHFLYIFLLISGIIIDFYSILPFPIITFSLFIAILFLRILSQNVFTNRSLYSLFLMGIIGTIIYNIILIIFVYLTYLLRLSDFSFLFDKELIYNIIWQVFACLLFLTGAWFFISFLKSRFKKTFLNV